ncbi:MAG TPA: hypothetical protein DCQ31_07590, partial [Bacteroidales bacterium]|nr:hypothetical protein [Bacteroidales bacterium]
YGADSLAHSVHLHEGWIAQNSLFALPVHATQIYEIVFMVLLLALTALVQYKKVFQSERSLLFFSFGVYAVFRFFEEFIRDGGHEAFGLKVVQLILLGLILLFTGLIYRIERSYNRVAFEMPEVNTAKSLKVVILNTMLIVVGLNLYSPLELVLLKTLLLFIIVGFIVALIRESFANKLVRMPVLMLVAAVLFMGQTTTEQVNPVDTLKTFFTVSGGAAQGKYTEICGSTHNYTGSGLGARYTGYLNKDAMMYGGVNYYYLQKHFESRLNNKLYSTNVFTPYIGLDSKYLEMMAGFNIAYDFNNPTTGLTEEQPISLYGRLGSRRSFFADAGIFNSFPADMPIIAVGFGVGTKKYGTIARFGLSESGFYLNPFIRLNKNVVIEPIIYYGDQNLYQVALRTHINLYLKPRALRK